MKFADAVLVMANDAAGLAGLLRHIHFYNF